MFFIFLGLLYFFLFSFFCFSVQLFSKVIEAGCVTELEFLAFTLTHFNKIWFWATAIDETNGKKLICRVQNSSRFHFLHQTTYAQSIAVYHVIYCKNGSKLYLTHLAYMCGMESHRHHQPPSAPAEGLFLFTIIIASSLTDQKIESIQEGLVYQNHF